MANAANKKSSGTGTGSKKKASSAVKKNSVNKTAGRHRTRRGRPSRKQQTNGVRVEVILLCILAAAILLMLSNFGVGGIVGTAVSDFFFGLFGISAWIFPIVLFGGTSFYLANSKNLLVMRKLIGSVVCFFLFCAFMQLLTAGYNETTRISDYFTDSVYDHLGGGLFGGLLVRIFGLAFGKIGAYVIVITGIIICAVIITQKPFLSSLQESGNRVWHTAREQRKQADARRREEHKRRAAVSAERDVFEDDSDLNEETENVKNTVHSEKPRTKRFPFDFNLKEEKKTHQMEMPELSIHRGPVQESAESDLPELPSDEQSSVTDPSAGTEKEKKGKNQKSSSSEIAEGIDHIRKEITETSAATKTVYKFPPLSLLKRGDKKANGDSDAHLRETAHKLEQTLRNFGVNVSVTNVSCGPTVTRYELLPEQGVKVSKIVSLTDDIKLNLAAADIRIEAPIPGKAAVGIEVPNATNTPVMLRDLLESPAFRNHPSKIAFAVGKDIAGQPVVTDIAKMPHLLIAGATGSGKSVCINTLIMSILYKAKPEDVRLIMIDPKVVELSVYNGIPHLFIPVVTDPKKASGALNWAVSEMTDRYNKFAEYNVRDIRGYNAKISESVSSDLPDAPQKMPQIVIIVDELADLMMVAPGEVEDAICRLAQLARAAGIHLIIATQRPSVNVITGLIKANMPSRIAFSVSSGVDSRTILDMNGAEKLLGKGDMLFKPQDYQKPARLQGAFVSDKEVADVVAFLKEHFGEVSYSPEMEQQISRAVSEAASPLQSRGEDRDAYFTDAGKFIIEKDKASIGMLQRVFKIGFNRAARIMDQLCEAGVVGEEEGTKPRKILMTMEQFEQYLSSNS